MNTLKSIIEGEPASQYDSKSLGSLSKLFPLPAPRNSEHKIRNPLKISMILVYQESGEMC